MRRVDSVGLVVFLLLHSNHTRRSHYSPSYIKSAAPNKTGMSSENGTSTGSTTSWEAVAFLNNGPMEIMNSAGESGIVDVMLPVILTRKLTNPSSAWNKSDDPILGSAGHPDKLASWRDELHSSLVAANSDNSTVANEEHMRNEWFQVLEKELMNETGSQGIFKDQTITLKLVGPEELLGSTIYMVQGVFDAATRSTEIKTFSGGVEVRPSEGTSSEKQTASTSASASAS